MGYKSTGIVFAEKPSIGIEPTRLYDRSRHKNHGTHSNITMVQLPSGLWVRSFNGSSSDVAIVNNEATKFGTGDLTLLLWVRLTALSALERMLGGATNGITFYQNSSNQLVIEEEGVGGTVTSSSALSSASVWYMVVAKRTSGTISFSINAVDAGGGGAFARDFTGDIDYVGRLGASYFDGDIALIKMCDYALSAGQIKKLFEEQRHWFGV